MVMAVMMSGFGRGFGDAPADQQSCGTDSQRRAPPGSISRREILTFQHIAVPRDSIATYVASGTPVPFEWLPFGGLMRRKRGSNLLCSGLKHLVTRSS